MIQPLNSSYIQAFFFSPVVSFSVTKKKILKKMENVYRTQISRVDLTGGEECRVNSVSHRRPSGGSLLVSGGKQKNRSVKFSVGSRQADTYGVCPDTTMACNHRLASLDRDTG